MSRTGRFSTALRNYARRQIEHLGAADIVVGIPAYYSDESLAHVIRMVKEGLEHFYPEKKCLIIVADGGSTDDTREVAQDVENHHFNMDVLVTIYRGIPGKGSAFRAVFEAASYLRASAVAVFDSDLQSIKPGWVRNILDPVFNGYDFVAPDYSRYKFDGTITNNIVYNQSKERIHFVDLSRSEMADYVQDGSVFLVSNFRIPVFEEKLRDRLNGVIEIFFEFLKNFSQAQGDETFDARMALGLARSFYTSTRFEMNPEFAKEMYLRAVFLLEKVFNHQERPWDAFKLPNHVLYY